MKRNILLTLAALLLVASCAPTPAAPKANEITLAEASKTFTLKVGESFLLKLGEEYAWAPQVADDQVVSRVKNIAVVRGAQGVYQALKKGRTSLTASGDPVCRQSNPPCAKPSLRFTVTLIVTD